MLDSHKCECKSYENGVENLITTPLEYLCLHDFKRNNIIILHGVDPIGNVIFTNNKVYRGIHKQYVEEYSLIYKICQQHELFGNYIINTKIADDFSLEPFGLMFEHEFVSPYIYPFEWSLSMTIDAAYAVLNLVKKLDEIGLGLKDGHPFNSAYHKGSFYFIDFGSIVRQKTPSWMVQEFINTFVNWIICKTKGIGHNKVLIDEDISTYLNKEEQEQYTLFKRTISELATFGEISQAIDFLFLWIRYYESLLDIISPESNIPEPILNTIVKFITNEKIKQIMLVSGNFSNICFSLSPSNISIIVLNEDSNYVDYLYTQIKQKIFNISSAYINFLNPNGPNDCTRWFNAEIRFASEMVIVFNYFLTQTDHSSLHEILKKFTLKYAAIEVYYPLKESLLETIKQNFDVMGVTKESYDNKKLLFLKVK